MRLESWSQMLFRNVQKSQQNIQSTYLKVKKVTSSLSDCESLFRMTVVKFWSNHSEKKVTVNQSNELINVNHAHRPSNQHWLFYEWFLCDMKINGRVIK